MNLQTFLASTHSFCKEDRVLAFRFKALNIMLLLAIFTSLSYVPVLYFELFYSPYHLVERNTVFALILIVLFFILRRSPEHYKIVLNLSLIMIFILFVHTLFVETDNTSRHLWFLLVITMAYYLGSRALGIMFTLVTMATLLVYDLQTFMPSNLSFLTLVDAISITTLLSLVLALFVNEYTDIVEELKSHQVVLENQNRDLNSKVKIESLENKVKTELMIEESRFAQIGRILSLIAHHWRQPLSCVSIASADMRLSILMGTQSQKSFLNNLDTVDNNVQELSETINDFRDFFQSSKNLEVLKPQEIIQDAFKIMRDIMESSGVAFSLDFNYEAEIKIYKNEMGQAVLNILTNAHEIFIQRKVDNGKIWIRSFRYEEDVIIEIEDNAGGIEIDDLSNIFEPYFSTKEQRNGTGLGLYISKTIVEHQTNGSLSVKRTDNGLCFIIAVPRFIL